MPRTSKEKLWMIGAGIVAFILVLIGYFMFISSQNSQTSGVRASVATANQHIAAARARVNSLQQQYANLAKYEADLEQAHLALPTTSGMPDFLRTLQALGAATQTTITSISVSPPAPLTAAGGSAASSGTSKSSTGSGTSGTSGTAAGAGSGAASGSAVYSLSITMTVSGAIGNFGDFLTQLQSVQPRAVLLSSVQETQTAVSNSKGGGSGGSTLSISMEAFVQPESK